MATREYTVRLDAFEGPLDLLLQLIRRAELDITEITLATITDQYLAHVEQLDTVDMDQAGEFLVVAATLIEVKSRHLAPDTPGAAIDDARASKLEIDPAAELLSQLLEYKAFREAGRELERRKDNWSRRFPAGRAHADRAALRDAVGGEDALDMDELSLFDLVSAFEKIASTIVFDRLGTHDVETDETPIELHAADILDRLERAGALADEHDTDEQHAATAIRIRAVFEGRRKPEIIGLFLAVLELVKQRRVRVTPGETFATDPTDIRVQMLQSPKTPDAADEDADPQDANDDGPTDSA